MSSTIYLNLRTDRQYKASTGLSLTEFNSLYDLFQRYYEPKQQLLHLVNKPVLLADKKEALFFILHYLKAYPTLQNMGLYFGMSDSAVSDFITLLKPCLKAALQHQQGAVARAFANQQEFDEVFSGVEDIFIDVTEIPIERSANLQVQRDHYSGKKNTFAQSPAHQHRSRNLALPDW